MQILLKTHGTCSTITSLDQMMVNLQPDQRAQCAALLVRTLHQDLFRSVERDLKNRSSFNGSATTIHELTSGNEWLFDENNYHIDVSHLHSIVRFSRSLSPEATELKLAVDLAEYGSQLSKQFQYPGEPPFEDFYPAHIHFLSYLQNGNRAEAMKYFQNQLEQAIDPQTQAMIAYVMVDLLARTDQIEEALPLAEEYLVTADHDFAAAFSELCQKAGRFDVLLRSAQDRNDLVTYTSALIQQAQAKAG